jgi:hypothetical protein
MLSGWTVPNDLYQKRYASLISAFVAQRGAPLLR